MNIYQYDMYNQAFSAVAEDNDNDNETDTDNNIDNNNDLMHHQRDLKLLLQ